MAHIVTAPLVVAKQEDGSDVYLYQGVEVPESLSSSEVKRLRDGGFIEKVKAEQPDPSIDEEPFKGVSVADLKAEIAKRNEGREDDKKIVPVEPGNRPEIVAALVADDETSKQ